MQSEAYSFTTPLGTMHVALRVDRLAGVHLPGGAPIPSRPATEHPRAAALAERMAAHLSGETDDFLDLELDYGQRSAFAVRVYEALRRQPPGTVVSYGELAARAGSPGASRAVGSAMATNPLPLVVPCHRVVASGGRLGGFSAAGGVATKIRMLIVEGMDPLALETPARTHLRSADRVLGSLLKRGGPKMPAARPPEMAFTDLCSAVAMQQLAVPAARAILGRVVNRWGKGGVLSSSRIAASDLPALRRDGLSEAKARVFMALAQGVESGALDLNGLRRQDDGVVSKRLTAIRGIGPWTAQCYLLFHLQRPDVFPADDLGLRRGAAKLYGLEEMPDARALRDMSQTWAPFRSLASMALWHVLGSSPPVTAESLALDARYRARD